MYSRDMLRKDWEQARFLAHPHQSLEVRIPLEPEVGEDSEVRIPPEPGLTAASPAVSLEP